ncbi:MAG: TRAP transporter permease [Bacillota bacterium]
MKQTLGTGEQPQATAECQSNIAEEGIKRKFTGTKGKIVAAVAISFSLFQIWVNSIGVVPEIFRNAVHLSFLLVLTFTLFPARKNSPRDKLSKLDIILIIFSISVGLYILFFYNDLHLKRGSIAISRDYVFAIIAIVLTLEAARRVVGWLIPALSVFFLIYAAYGPYFPGLFGHAGLDWTRILYRMYLTYEGLFGITLTVSATFIFLFILFGAFLTASGASGLFNDLALGLAGRMRGGPAQVAVISSALMGTLSGSPAANVATTGSFTIPLMKRIGYKPFFAGAVEAAASTGGMIMPPIMGAAAFIMASFLGVPYLRIVTAAIVPALLYFAAVMIMIDIEAKRLGLKGLEKNDIPSLKKVFLERGALLLPIIVIIWVLISGKTPLYAGFAGIIATIAASYTNKECRIGLKKLLWALEHGALGSIQVGIACASVGIIVGVAAMTGIGSVMAYNIVNLSGGSVFAALALVMLTSIVLSFGLPSTALYIIVAIVAAPALVKLGVLPLAAHFFVFWFGALSNVTPPVALASYTAAGIAGAEPMKTAWTALKLTLAGFIIPFMFAFNPVILFESPSILAVGIAFITGLIGVFGLAIATKAYFIRQLFILEQLLFFGGAVMMINPGLRTDAIGLVILVLAMAFHYITRKKTRGGAVVSG